MAGKERAPFQIGFGFVRYEAKRIDGKGPVYTFYQTPSAAVRSNRLGATDTDERILTVAYFSAEAAGALGQMGVDFSDCESVRDKVLKLFDCYRIRLFPLDDDGEELPDPESEEGEPDPT